MKRILILVLVALISLSSFTACNNTTTETDDESQNETEEINRLPAVEVSGEGFELALSEDKSYYTFVGKGTSADEKLTVPSTFDGLPIKDIADGAFIACEGISEIIVSEGITSIGKNAFAFSKDLKSVTLPNTVTEISERAFYSCSKLETINLGNATTKIGVSAFEACSSLKAIALPESVKIIGAAAFYNCASLAGITLGSSIESIGKSAFDATAFATNAQNKTDKTLYCGKYLLKVSADKNDALTIKDGTLLIADHAAKQTEITSISFPTSLKYIGEAAFTACQGLTDIKINEGVVSIGNNAFSSCDSLVSATLSSTLKDLGAFAFYHCSTLKAIAIPNGVTAIAEEAFNECASLEDITLHNNLKSIGVYSFANCVNLKKIALPDSLTTIGESAFYKCYNLMSVNLPISLTKIDGWAFQYCHKLVDVKNESTLNIVADSKNTSNGYVGVYAKEIHNGESKIVEQDGYFFYTFEGKNYLMGYEDMNATTLTLPESYGTESYIIYKYAISFRPELQSVSIPEGVTAMHGNSIDNCDNVTELTLGTSVKSIAKNAVNLCPAFNKLTYLGTEAEFNAITINTPNALLLNAQRVYGE